MVPELGDVNEVTNRTGFGRVGRIRDVGVSIGVKGRDSECPNCRAGRCTRVAWT